MMSQKRMVILLLIGSLFVVTSQDCPSSCECDRDGIIFEVDCIGKALTSVPKDIPPNTTTLSLQKNSITSLSPSDFQNLVNLTDLRLDENSITEIEDNTFFNNSNLLVLSLNRNKLNELNTGTFKGASQLKSLYLQKNPDLTVQPGTFQQFEGLQHLYVSDTSFPGSYDFENMINLVDLEMVNCSITSLTSEYFAGLGGLTSLSLDMNQLTNISFLSSLPLLQFVTLSSNEIAEIPSGSFDSNQQLRKINMDSNHIEILYPRIFSGLKNFTDGSFRDNHIQYFGQDIFDEDANLTSSGFRFEVNENPINCDCKMKWLAATIIKGQCDQPSFVNGRDFNSMNVNDYQCGPRSMSDGKAWFTVDEGVSTTLECPITIEPPEEITWETPFGNITLSSNDQKNNEYILETGNLKITKTMMKHRGVYYCSFGNKLGDLRKGPFFVDVEEESGSTVLALSISLAVVTILLLFLLFILLRKRLRGTGDSRYRFLLENKSGSTAEI